LPDLPGIGTGESVPVPAVPAEPASIGTQRVAGEVQPGEGSTYSRGSYRVEPQPSQSAENLPEQSTSGFRSNRNLDDIDARTAARPQLKGPPKPARGVRRAIEPEDTRAKVGDFYSDAEPINARAAQTIPPPVEPAAAEGTPLIPKVTTTVDPVDAQPTPAVPQRDSLIKSESTSVDPRAPPTQPEAPGAIDDMFPNVPGSDEDLNQRISNLRGPTATDDDGLPELSEADKAVDDTSNILKSVAEKEAVVAPEEEIADAIPGVGEIIGGIIGIGAAVAGISEAVSAAKDKGPTQPGGTPSMSTAFDSAPVIDSSSYHNL
jgi:hypothetical protein